MQVKQRIATALGLVVLLSVANVWAHGDVTLQPIDTTGLEPIKDSGPPHLPKRILILATLAPLKLVNMPSRKTVHVMGLMQFPVALRPIYAKNYRWGQKAMKSFAGTHGEWGYS